ncbi:phospholipase A(2) [Trichonephila clavata]|uniref:Phospholipase A2 n=1 Tax=Trichonephila clavata TaxID=2740835 RepID=A0A8X6LSU3_TRICU|nr:phospholipase A(2) [Trichonephila clavata]
MHNTMRTIASWIVLFLLSVLTSRLNSTVIDLSNMLSYTTHRNPLDFLNYGNWCGLGGSGYTLDTIDRCCKMHDLCYEDASDRVCIDEKPHLAAYRWKTYGGKIHCNKADYPCGLAACRCDGKFSSCVAAYKHDYNPGLKKVRPPLYNAIQRVLSNLSKNRRIDVPYISIKLV